MKTALRTLTTSLILLALAACGGGGGGTPTPPTTYTIGGTVSGLTGAGTVTLSDAGAGSSGAIGNGAFSLPNGLTTGTAYSVSAVASSGETCTVTSGSGTVGSANVTDIAVACTAVAAPTYTIGGTVTGLSGSLTLLDNGASSLTLSANGSFTFKTALAAASSYAVTVSTQPAGETCTVSNGSGTVGSADVTGVAVACTAIVPPSYTIGGTVSGLTTSASVVLENSADGESLTVGANGAFTFKTTQTSGQSYSVIIAVQPSGEACTISNGSGKVGSADITNITVACAAVPSYTIGGAVTGLTGGVTLLDNGASSLTLSANGSFTFKIALAAGSSYAVTVLTQPTGETCTVSNGSGKVGSANVTNVAVACASSGGGGGGTAGAFWIPYSAAPVSGTTGGKTGLFVIASNDIAAATAPAPQFVTTSPPTILGLAFKGLVSGSTPPTYLTPDTMIYSALGTDGNSHLYGLNLASTTLPAPTQITSLSVPPSKNICLGGQLEANATDPTTLSVVIYVATPKAGALPGTDGYCQGVVGGTYYLANYTDSSTTAPEVVNIPGGTATFPALLNDGIFIPLNLSSGVLGGLLYWDSVTDDENLYSNATFTSAKTLLSSVQGTPVACVNVIGVINGAKTYLEGSNLETVNTGSGYEAYEFTASGTATKFYGGLASDCFTDASNLYFIGAPSNTAASAIYQEPLALEPTPKTLFSGLPTAETSGFGLIGSNDSTLFFEEYSISGTGAVTSTILSVPEGVTSSGATTLGSYPGLLYSYFLASPGAGAAADDIIFLTERDQVTSTTISFSSQVLG
ncbi:MAG TPA: hypothetical protein VMQ54_09415, partial [Steroidobacteraceae bacterium]|nr:hypothetical protein [Steroidobacteraceae bacterium]